MSNEPQRTQATSYPSCAPPLLPELSSQADGNTPTTEAPVPAKVQPREGEHVETGGPVYALSFEAFR